MSGTAGHGKRRGGAPGHDDGERWLLTYADMITLLLALFIVLWSISSVNTSKFEDLKASLHSAFSGKVVNGSQSVLSGSSSLFAQSSTPVPMVNPATSAAPNVKASLSAQITAALAAQDIQNLAKMKQSVDAYAKANAIDGQLQTSVDQRGLVIHVLTDQLLFSPGHAMLEPQAAPLLDHVAQLLTMNGLANPIRVEGNTDSIPIKTAQFRSNWELSAARAAAVLEFLLGRGVPQKRLSLAGYADQSPVASNATADGRSRNRRVDIVILRRS